MHSSRADLELAQTWWRDLPERGLRLDADKKRIAVEHCVDLPLLVQRLGCFPLRSPLGLVAVPPLPVFYPVGDELSVLC